MKPQVQPLPYRHRNHFFYFLVSLFAISIPFLFLYAAGYKFYFDAGELVSTGGLYIAAERTGAEIYINDELVRETRVFRRAFYAQGLEAGTYRVHVQKDNHHTWVKELPVYSHLVTEAQAFNLPLRPSVRIITPYVTRAGVAVLTASSTVANKAAITNQVLVEPRASTSTLAVNPEYIDIMRYFSTSTKEVTANVPAYVTSVLPQNTEVETATTTKENDRVRLFEQDGEVYARYIGNYSAMPYYYCADDFARYNPLATSTARHRLTNIAEASEVFENNLMLEVQTVAEPVACEPLIKMDAGGDEILYFDFFPGSSDLVILGGQNGVYVAEIDDRVWQNRQFLLQGQDLEVRVVNGSVFIHDGISLYQVQVEEGWF